MLVLLILRLQFLLFQIPYGNSALHGKVRRDMGGVSPIKINDALMKNLSKQGREVI